MKKFLFIIFPPTILLLYTYNPFKVLNYLESIIINETEFNLILKHISETFSEVYAYNEISKNPPQPLFNNNYHNKVDIQHLLNKMQLKNISFYEFYRNIIHQISELKDLHIDIYFNNNTIFNLLKNLYAICPIKFEIAKINEEYQILGKVNQYYQYYNKDIIDLIQDNYNKKIYIKTINNLCPFFFIDNFCGNIGKTKNPHGTFSHKFNAHYGYNLAIFPLEFNDLNINIEYSNGDKINLEYIFVSNNELPQLNYIKNENDLVKFGGISGEFINKINLENNLIKLKLSKLQKEFNKYMNITEKKYGLKENLKISWNYQYESKTSDILKCKIDELNKVNIYYIHSFSTDNHSLYKETFLNCTTLFDKNNYPIIVILNKNNGGYADLSKLMLELISPFISITKYMSIRINKNKITDEDTKINYGENITDYLTNPIEDLIWLNNEIIKYKYNIKNKRIPTDILILTDGYSFSAAATFIKYLQYYGGAIIAGFFGNPKLDNIPFDSGQSPSSIFCNDTLYFVSNSYKILNDKYNITMNMPGNQYFFDDLNLNIPLEYLLTPVDERINIYQNFKDSNYDLFINEALKIIEKYKTRCNPFNKRLVYYSDNCKGKFENDYTFGGYECDNDGFWSKKCVPMFCDIEYVYNHKLNKCILRKKERDLVIIYIIILVIISACFVYISLSYIFNGENGDKNSESNSEEEELVDISDKN